MAVTAAQISELRKSTGAGMLDCKKALEQTDGNFEQAVDFLRTKGLAAASKKAGRAATEGMVAAAVSCLLYTSPSPRDGLLSRMPSSA